MTHEFVTNLVWLVPLPPLLAFALIVLFTNKNKASKSYGGNQRGIPFMAGSHDHFLDCDQYRAFWRRAVCIFNPLAADWRDLVEDRRADRSALCRGFVLRGVDSVDDLHLQRWLS